MRWLLLLAVLPLPVAAQYTLYTCMVTSKDYVVGAKLPPSGIFLKSAGGEWRHAGYNHPFINALDYDPRIPATLYVAAGNGLIRVTGTGETVEDSDRQRRHRTADVAVDRNAPGTDLLQPHRGHSESPTTAAPPGRTRAPACTGSTPTAIRVDSRQARRIWWRATKRASSAARTAARSWQLAGAAGFQVLHIEQSPHDACYWLAATQGGGLFVSTDCGVTFESNGNLGVGRNLYDIAFDPASPDRIAVAGWGVGVAISRRSRQDVADRATPDCRRRLCGASRSIRPSRAASTPACTRRRSTSRRITARPGRKDGLEGSRVLSHEVRSGAAAK